MNIYYVIHSSGFGDTLSATPTLRYLSKAHQSKINVVTHNKQVFKGNPYIERLLDFNEFIEPENIIRYDSFTYNGLKDKNGIEKKFSHIDIRQVHAMDLGFQLTPEQMDYDYYPDPMELECDLPDHYVVLHVTNNWANRTWDYQKWTDLIQWLADNKIYTVLIGLDHREALHSSISDTPLEKQCPQFDNLYGLDLSNKTTISEVWHVINGAKCIVTMDTGPLHLAGTTDAHIIQLGSAIHPSLRAPYRNGSQNYKYDYIGGSCNLFCNSNLLYYVKEWGNINGIPPLTGCLEGYNEMKCHPSTNEVVTALEKIIQGEQKLLTFWYEEGQIRYNFNCDLNEEVKLISKDVLTGFKSTQLIHTVKKLSNGHYYWWKLVGDNKHPRDVRIEVYKNDKLIESHIVKREDPKEYYIYDVPINSSLIKITDSQFSYGTFWDVFIEETYKHDIVKIEKDDIVLDIGANYGFFSLWALENGAKKTYAVEPDPKCFKELKKLSFQFPIEAINKAVYSKSNIAKLKVYDELSECNHINDFSVLFEKPEDDEIEVTTVNINDLLDTIKCDIGLVKIDCEGAEQDIFETITDENLAKIKKFIIEAHSTGIKNQIVDRLKVLKFNVWVNFEDDLENKHMFHNIYAIQKEL